MRSAIIFDYIDKIEDSTGGATDYKFIEYFVPYDAKALANEIRNYNPKLAEAILKGEKNGKSFERLVVRFNLGRFLKIENIDIDDMREKGEWVNDREMINEPHLSDYLFEFNAANIIHRIVQGLNDYKEYGEISRQLYRMQSDRRNFKMIISILSYLDENDFRRDFFYKEAPGGDSDGENKLNSIAPKLRSNIITYLELIETYLINNNSKKLWKSVYDKYRYIFELLNKYEFARKDNGTFELDEEMFDGKQEVYQLLVEIMQIHSRLQNKEKSNEVIASCNLLYKFLYNDIRSFVINAKINEIKFFSDNMHERENENGYYYDIGTWFLNHHLLDGYGNYICDLVNENVKKEYGFRKTFDFHYSEANNYKYYHELEEAIKDTLDNSDKVDCSKKLLGKFGSGGNGTSGNLSNNSACGCLAVMCQNTNDILFTLSGAMEYSKYRHAVPSLINYIQAKLGYNAQYAPINVDNRRYTHIIWNHINVNYIGQGRYATLQNDMSQLYVNGVYDSNTIGNTYGCCERKLFGNNCNRVIQWIICKFEPCFKCRPAVFDANVPIFYVGSEQSSLRNFYKSIYVHRITIGNGLYIDYDYVNLEI